MPGVEPIMDLSKSWLKGELIALLYVNPASEAIALLADE